MKAGFLLCFELFAHSPACSGFFLTYCFSLARRQGSSPVPEFPSAAPGLCAQPEISLCSRALAVQEQS